MKILEFKKSKIGRRKLRLLEDESANNPCVLDIRALKEARLLANESKKLGGGPTDVFRLAKELSADY